jgi:hypothetical protein
VGVKCEAETELSLNSTKNGSRTFVSRARFTAMVHILGVQLFETNFVKVCLRQPVFLFAVPLILFLACVDPFLWNKSPHGGSHLRSPPDPRQLPCSPALRNTNNIHRRVSLITVHISYPPACSSRVPRIPGTIPINAPPKPGRSTHIPCAARHTSSATPTSQNQGRGPTPLAEDRDGLETRDAGEYCSSTHDRELRRQETCDESAGARAEYADERKDGEKTQQSRAVSVVFRSLVRLKCPLDQAHIRVRRNCPLWYTQNCTVFTSYHTDRTPYPYRVNPPKSSHRQLVLLPLDILQV